MSIPLIAAAFGLIWHFGGQEVRRFERLAAEDIRAHLSGEGSVVTVRTSFSSILGGPLGELDEVTIKARGFSAQGLPLYTEPKRSKAGKIRLLRLQLRDFVLGGLRIDSFDADIPDCRFDYALALRRHRFRLSRSGVGQGRVSLSQDALAAFILRKYRDVKDVSVRIDRDKLFLEGHGTFLLVQTGFWIVCGLEAQDGVRLNLSRARVFFDDRPAGDGSTQMLLRTWNPVVDLDRDLGLQAAVHVAGMRLRDGRIEAWGEATVPALEEPAKLRVSRSVALSGEMGLE